jgi:DNA repair protein RecO (recombination protein O)
MRDRLYKTQAVVLKSIDLGEADKIVTLFSPSFSRISAVAKGIRKTKSKFGGRLEPFTEVNLLLHKGRNLDVITQAEIVSSFQLIRTNFERLNYGFPMLDIVDKIAQEGEKEREIYDLLISALQTLEEMTDDYSLLLAAFHLKITALAGYLPKLSSCSSCSGSSLSQERLRFSFSLGGILCSACSGADPAAVQLSPAAAALLMPLLRADRETLKEMKAQKEIQDELLLLTRKCLYYYLEIRPKSLDYLAKLSKSTVNCNYVGGSYGEPVV